MDPVNTSNQSSSTKCHSYDIVQATIMLVDVPGQHMRTGAHGR